MPPRRRQPSPQLERLKALQGQPQAQAALAQEIVAESKDAQAIRAALDVLREHPQEAARPALLARYAFYAEDGVRRDAGTYLRAAILKALRPVARPDDLPLLERAAATYEFLPPTRSEEASQLRSAALVVMNDVDPGRAALHAVRLLGDPLTSMLSGEPALTAVRVLAAQDNLPPVYFCACYFNTLFGEWRPVDVLAECLKTLAALPEPLFEGLLAQYQASQDEVVMVGLIDMVLGHGPSATSEAFVRDFLRNTSLLAVYRYLVTTLVVSHHPTLLPLAAEAASHERNPRKLTILEEAFALGGSDPVAQAALKQLHKARRHRT